MKRGLELWLFTTTLTLLALAVLVIIAQLTIAYLPFWLLLAILVTTGAALSMGIAALVRRHTRY